MQLSRRNTQGERTRAAERKQCDREMFRRRRSSSRRTHSQRGGGMEAAGKRREGARWKIGEANKWGVTKGSTGLKINMIRRKTGDRLMEGNIRVEGVSKWRQVRGGEDRKNSERQADYKNGGGRWNQASHTTVAVCGLLATLSAMHLFLSYWICTKQDVSLVIPESDPQYISCIINGDSICLLLTIIAYWAKRCTLSRCYTGCNIDRRSLSKIAILTNTLKGLTWLFF